MNKSQKQKGEMIALERALEVVLKGVEPLAAETVALDRAQGRVLSDVVKSDMDMPPFDKSAMDGYAYAADDKADSFEVVETIAAGTLPTEAVGPGQCAKIMTGAAVPEGADAVVRVEYTEEQDGHMRIVKPEKQTNVCIKGEDMRAGDVLLKSGSLVTVPIVGVLASVGYSDVPVYRQPRVAVIATGHEIVEPSDKPGPGQIRNSNSYQLCAQVREAGGVPEYMGIARDTEEDLDSTFRRALESADIILLSGGVSMGDFDLVPGVLKANSVDIAFDQIAVKPGRPTVFGTRDTQYVFGLPGNPVSTFVIFDLLVKPLMLRLSGHEHMPLLLRGELACDVKAKKSRRAKYLPAIIDSNNQVRLPEYHGSAHLGAYAEANALLCIEPGQETLAEGTKVHVRQIRP